MTPQEMQARSSDKVKEVMTLLKTLHLRVEARERMSQDGFIEKIVFWIDDEIYPSAAPEGATAAAPQQEESAAEPSQQEVGTTVTLGEESASIETTPTGEAAQ